MKKELNENDMKLYEQLAELSDLGTAIYGSEYTNEWIETFLPVEERELAKKDFRIMQLAEGHFKKLFTEWNCSNSKEVCMEQINTFTKEVLSDYLQGYSTGEQQGIMLHMLTNATDYTSDGIKEEMLASEQRMELANLSAEELGDYTTEAVKETAFHLLECVDIEALKQGMENMTGEIAERKDCLSGKELSVSGMAIATYLMEPNLRKVPEVIVASCILAQKMAEQFEGVALAEGMDRLTYVQELENVQGLTEDVLEVLSAIWLILLYITILLSYIWLFTGELSPLLMTILTVCGNIVMLTTFAAVGALMGFLLYASIELIAEGIESMKAASEYDGEAESEYEEEDEFEEEYAF